MNKRTGTGVLFGILKMTIKQQILRITELSAVVLHISSCVLYLFCLCFVILFYFFISTIVVVVNKDMLYSLTV